MLLVENSSLVSRPPSFRRGYRQILASSMQAASDLAASVFVVSITPPLNPAGVREKHIFPAPAQPPARLAPAGTGQKHISPEPAKPQAPKLRTAVLGITPSTHAPQTGSVGVGTDNAPPTPTNPQRFFTPKPRPSVLRRSLFSLRQPRTKPRPTVPQFRSFLRLYLSCLPLLRLTRLPLSRQISF